jgi:dihydroorotate dehydrogenase
MIYQALLRPLLFLTPPEWIHHASLYALGSTPFPQLLSPFVRPALAPTLTRNLFGLEFPNPIGVAAGFDKNALAVHAWEQLGFGFMELGTITPKGQPGNPAPRIFRLKRERGLINRLGFPNEGTAAVKARLQKVKESGRWPKIPVGLNIGKNKDTPLTEAGRDYLTCFQQLRGLGDYFVVNISSPNTPGLRDLQQPEFLKSILEPLRDEDPEGKIPLLIKVSPDVTESQIADVIAAAEKYKLAGIIATNTTLDKSAVSLKEEGGLSGLPLTNKSTEIIRQIRKQTKLPIIGVGGIMTPRDAVDKLQAGADLLQIYTGYIYEGPWIIQRICERLLREGN